MSFTQIKYEKSDQVALITFNRPEVMNCLGPVVHRELIQAWSTFKNDETALVAVITGAGDEAFCAGGDIKAAAQGFLDLSAQERAAHARGERPGFIGPTRWTDIKKPIIAAINGLAYAGGLEWACFADIRIAAEHATFGVTCRCWNIGLGDGGTQRLPQIVGLGRALELILTGKVIDAQEAWRIGLVNEIVPRGHALPRALELARFLASLPQPAMRTDKEAVMKGLGLPLDQGLKIEAECFIKLLDTPELQAGIRRFVERDHPDLKSGETPVTPGLAKKQG